MPLAPGVKVIIKQLDQELLRLVLRAPTLAGGKTRYTSVRWIALNKMKETKGRRCSSLAPPALKDLIPSHGSPYNGVLEVQDEDRDAPVTEGTIVTEEASAESMEGDDTKREQSSCT